MPNKLRGLTAERPPTTLAGMVGHFSTPNAGAFAGLFACGFWVTSFGPTLPFLARETEVGLGTAGLALTGLAAGSISASALVSLRLGGMDPRRLIVLGLVFASLGLAAIGVAPTLALVLAGAVVLGVGDGLVVASTHGLVTIASPDPAQSINRLNLFFAIGAILGPLWAGVALETTGDLEVVYGGLAAFMLALATFVWTTPSAGHGHEIHGRLVLRPTVILMGLVLFLYVGAEIGLGAWLATYAEEAAEASVIGGAVVTSGYWGALAIGRLITGPLLARREPFGLLLQFVAAAGLASLVLALFGEVLAVAFGAAFLTGLFFGPIWPLAMAVGTRDSNPSTTAALVTAGNSGALVFPVAQGAVLASAGPTEGVAVTAALCALMLSVGFGWRASVRVQVMSRG